MRSITLFLAGLTFGLMMQTALAQSGNRGVVMMNHLGVNVPDIPQAVSYYTQKMGYKEAFRVTTTKGSRPLSTCRSARTRFSNSIRPMRSGLSA